MSGAHVFAWELAHRHRWGLAAVAMYLAALAAIKLALATGALALTSDSTSRFALMVVVPTTATFFYFVAVFSFGLTGDLAARESMYPRRLFTLPVTNAALAGWPMVYGAVAMVVLWTGTRLFALWPSGVEVPAAWPGLMAAALLAWTQALTWMPYPSRGLRVIAIVLCLTALDAAVFTALELRAREIVMLALLAPHLPLAYVAARVAVARGRRGDVPGWRGLAAPQMLAGPKRSLAGDAFASAARAQIWYEWRRHGWSLPALVALLLPFEIFLLYVLRETPVLVLETLLGMLLTPVVMAGFVAATISGTTASGGASGLPPFIATRPLPTSALVGATVATATWSTAAAWLLVATAIPAGLEVSGRWTLVLDRAHSLAGTFGTPRAIALGALGAGALMLWTWRRLLQNLYIGFTGRDALIKSSVFFTLSVVAVAVPVLHWIAGNGRIVALLWDAAQWILATLALCKVALAIPVMVRAHRAGLVSDRALVIGAAAWSLTVLLLYRLLMWIMDVAFFPNYIFGLVAILAVPLARLTAAPLALASNRHRS